MNAVLRPALVMVLLAGCSGGDVDTANTSVDTLTRAQRDSVIGASRLPGAAGVRGALRIADSAAARQAARDSLLPD
ncbi:hypothetical protein BH23GEM9_BH23GEM9_09320 [soil metagenome]